MRKVFRASVLLLSGFLLMGLGRASAQMSSPQGPQPITPAMEQKVDAMVQKLTLKQKIALIGGEDSMYIRAEPSIGFPRLKMSDGPLGVRTGDLRRRMRRASVWRRVGIVRWRKRWALDWVKMRGRAA